MDEVSGEVSLSGNLEGLLMACSVGSIDRSGGFFVKQCH